MSEKLATLIGIQVVGLHQGQRKYAPRKQAGHMTAVDQIVRNVEKVLARGGRPHMTLRAMPIATTIIGDDFVGAVLAARDMPAEGRRAAALDRRHHLQLGKAHMAGVGFAPRRSVITEDICDLQSRTPHDPGLCGRLGVS